MYSLLGLPAEVDSGSKTRAVTKTIKCNNFIFSDLKTN